MKIRETLQERMEERAIKKVKEETRDLVNLIEKHPFGRLLQRNGTALSSSIKYGSDFAYNHLGYEEALQKRFDYHLQQEYDKLEKLMNDE